MSKHTIELGFNYSEQEYEDLLKDFRLTHLKNHQEKRIKVGDALKSSKGAIARVVEVFKNYENTSTDVILANNKLDIVQMNDQFNHDYAVTDQELRVFA